MRTVAPLKALSAAAALALLSGCANGSAIAPNMSSTAQSRVMHVVTRVPSVISPRAMLRLQHIVPAGRVASFNNCPAAGTIEYMSDFNGSMISIYSGNWGLNQRPCGMLTSANGLSSPQGLTVHDHKLYVANTGAGNVLAFHRGATIAFATYVDPTGGGEFPADVAVQKDSTVIATNISGVSQAAGSISTWNANGILVGNFVNPGGFKDYFLTVQRNGKVYFDDSGLELNVGTCPLGVCGSFANTGATGFDGAGGLRSASYSKTGFDVAVLMSFGSLLTYTSFPGGPSSSCSWPEGSFLIEGFDFNHTDHHVFGADEDPDGDNGYEMTYPGCVVIGNAPGGSNSTLIDVAVDRPGALD